MEMYMAMKLLIQYFVIAVFGFLKYQACRGVARPNQMFDEQSEPLQQWGSGWHCNPPCAIF